MPIQADKAHAGQRIAKLMARAGLCSRRDAEQWITEGRVSVNGEVLTSPAFNVNDADEVSVDGQPLRAPERTRLFLFHKPRGVVTTAKDPEGRATIFHRLPHDLPRVVAVGRLDINTEGLLLLTNDGGLSRVLELPATGWLRRYRVRAHGEITQEQLDALRDGITIDGISYLGIEARFERQQGSNVWLTMGLREGKNREIKRVLEHLGLGVNRLIRVSFGPFELADLEEGEVVEVRTRVLRDQLGPKLAKQAGANFDAPEAFESVQLLSAPPAPRGDRPLRRPTTPPKDLSSEGPPRKRKHVSVLRAEARDEAAGPRKRVVRATTSDRNGREVKIERVSLARKAEPPRADVVKRRPSRAARPREDVRGGFEERRPPRREDRPARSFGEGGRRESRPPGEKTFRPDRPRAAYAPQGERAPRRSAGVDERPMREVRAARPREGFEDRPPRQGSRAPRAESGRPPRAEGGRPPRTEGGRQPRAEGSRPTRPEGGRPPRAEGAPRHRPAGEKPFRSDRPRSFAPKGAPRSGGGGARPRGGGKGPPRGK